jgi:hypothetical protein
MNPVEFHRCVGSQVPKDLHKTELRNQEAQSIAHDILKSQYDGESMSYPLVNVYNKLWKLIIFNGTTHYFYGHFQVRKL